MRRRDGPKPGEVDLGIPGVTRISPVGQGGASVVYRGYQETFGRTVAVKVLSVQRLDTKTTTRFEHECRAMGALSGHPHVVAVYGSGVTAAGQPYLLLDYVAGGNLADRIRERGPFHWAEAASIGVKLAGALAAAHSAGVRHRDVKPENVLLSAFGEPQLADFGVARVRGGTETFSTGFTGTLPHTAPEVIDGEEPTEASDVYSLASTLYQLIAAHAPFVRAGDMSVMPLFERIKHEEPPDLTLRGVPPELWAVLQAALAKQPSLRTPTARVFGEALRRVQEELGERPTTMSARLGVDAVPATGTGAGDSTDPEHMVPLPDASSTYRRDRPPAVPVDPGPSPSRGGRRSGPRRPRIGLVAAAIGGLAVAAIAVIALATQLTGVGEPRGRSLGQVAITEPPTPDVPSTTTPDSAATTTTPAVVSSLPATTAPAGTAPVTSRPDPAALAPGAVATPATPAPTTAATVTPPTLQAPPATRFETYVLPAGTTCTSQGQLCSPTVSYPVSTAGFLHVSYQANRGCSSIMLHVILNGAEHWVSPPVAPDQDAGFTFPRLPPGAYTLELQAEGIVGGCNTGRLLSWGGSVTIRTSA